jgi:hypothetical protein
VAQLCRRLYGKYVLPPAEHLGNRVEQINGGRYDAMLDELAGLPEEELRKRYVERQLEPLDSAGWEPDDSTYL